MRRRILSVPPPTSAARRALPLPARRVSTFAAAAVAALALPAWAARGAHRAPVAGRDEDRPRRDVPGRRGVLAPPRSSGRGTGAGPTRPPAARRSPSTPPPRTRRIRPARRRGRSTSSSLVARLRARLGLARRRPARPRCSKCAGAARSPATPRCRARSSRRATLPSRDLSAEAIIAHEYGHHVAANRSNAPWAALDWGTKRWATYIQVCGRARDGRALPGRRA